MPARRGETTGEQRRRGERVCGHGGAISSARWREGRRGEGATHVGGGGGSGTRGNGKGGRSGARGGARRCQISQRKVQASTVEEEDGTRSLDATSDQPSLTSFSAPLLARSISPPSRVPSRRRRAAVASPSRHAAITPPSRRRRVTRRSAGPIARSLDRRRVASRRRCPRPSCSSPCSRRRHRRGAPRVPPRAGRARPRAARRRRRQCRRGAA